jgi:hypothetical protein
MMGKQSESWAVASWTAQSRLGNEDEDILHPRTQAWQARAAFALVENADMDGLGGNRYNLDCSNIEVPRVPYEKLTGERLGEPSSIVAARVQAARDRQQQRFAGQNSHIVCNADMTPAEVRVFCKLGATGQSLMRAQSTALGDAAITAFRARVSSRAQNRADDCRPGRE